VPARTSASWGRSSASGCPKAAGSPAEAR
jgi:hypothetical protein